VFIAKTDTGSRQVLPYGALPSRTIEARDEGLPQFRLRAVPDVNPGPGARVLAPQVDLVDGFVRKKGTSGIAPASRQRPCSRHVSPEIAVSRECHEKRREVVVTIDPVPGLGPFDDEGTSHQFVRLGPAVERTHCCDAAQFVAMNSACVGIAFTHLAITLATLRT
jgi:hypothetical protein